MKALVVYATVEGHTRKIASHIADVLADEGIESELTTATNANTKANDAYDLIVLCAPIHVGHYPKSLLEFIRESSAALTDTTTAFVSVSLGINSSDEKERAATKKCAEKLFNSANWRPTVVHHAAGAIQYEKYHFLKRLIMRWIVKREAGPMEAQKNHEFTNWKALNIFAKEMATTTYAQRAQDRLSVDVA